MNTGDPLPSGTPSRSARATRTGFGSLMARGGLLVAALGLLAACESLSAQDLAAARAGLSPPPVVDMDHAAATAQGSADQARQVAAAGPTSDGDPRMARGDDLVSDPLEPWNRYVFAVNDMVYTLARPWIAPYMVLPPEGQDKVDNLLHNLKTPVILLNDLLQGDFERAWITTKRFFINTTTGVLGLIDVAEKYGIPAHEEDFGQTLGTYGVGDGPYMVLPLFGPSNPRDAVGQAVDMVTHPLFWMGGSTGTMVNAGRTYGTASSEYGGRAEEMDTLRETSLDYYATIRSLYTQMRRGQIHNIDASRAQEADIDYFSGAGAPAETSSAQ